MQKSPFFVKSRPLTRADELRDQLQELEASIGRLGYGLGQAALTILPMFDAVSAGLALFEGEGQSMPAERARLETASAALSRKAELFLREIGGAGALQAARLTRQPDPASWWWFLDQLAAQRQRARLRRWLKVVGGVAVLVGLLLALYQLFLAPDPATRERIRHQQAAESLALEGDLAGALGEVEQALASAPGDPSLLVLKGVLQQELGQAAAAEASFAAAESAWGDRTLFLLARGQAYLLLNQAQAALADAQALLKLSPESARAYLLLGRAYEWLEDYPNALLAYQQASQLAESQDDYQLAGLARVNIATLMQRMQVQPAESN